MARSENQKLKLLYLLKYLEEKTDEDHSATVKDLIAYLKSQDIEAERKSIYTDMAALQQYGYDIIAIKGKPGGYYLASRDFELAELKLLVDAVQASKFVTTNKSRELIKKLEGLTSHEQARQLHRQVVVADRNKTPNESIYYNVDSIYQAMDENVEISFLYYEWTLKKEMVPKKEGARYQVSPWHLTWEDENYYLIAYDSTAGGMRYYRVDKMGKTDVTKEPRKGQEEADKIDTAAIAKKTFGMFAGEEVVVNLRVSNHLTGVMIDRFGVDVAMRSLDDATFKLRASVAVSNQFFGWLSGFGTDVELLGPEPVRDKYKQYVKELYGLYE